MALKKSRVQLVLSLLTSLYPLVMVCLDSVSGFCIETLKFEAIAITATWCESRCQPDQKVSVQFHSDIGPCRGEVRCFDSR